MYARLGAEGPPVGGRVRLPEAVCAQGCAQYQCTSSVTGGGVQVSHNSTSS